MSEHFYLYNRFLTFSLILVLTGSTAHASVETFVQALKPGNAPQAMQVSDTLPETISDEERQAILGALDRLSPGGEFLPLLQKLSERYGPDGDLIFQVARANWRAGDDAAALLFCGRAVAAEPGNTELLYKCAALAHTVNNPDKAKQWLEQLLELEPNQSDGLFLLGRIEASEGNDEKAREVLVRAVQTQKSHYLAYYELGRLENRAGNSALAERYLKAAVHFYPFFREAYNALLISLARLKKKDDIEKVRAIVAYLNTWTDDKENRIRFAFRNPSRIKPMAGYELAAELHRVGRSDLAKMFLEKALAVGQSNDAQRFFLAQLRFRESDFRGAMDLIEQLKDERITGSETYAEVKAWCLYHTGQLDESRTLLADGLQQFPDSVHLKQLQETLETSEPKPESKPEHRAFQFVDVAQKAGLDRFVHTIGNADKRWILDAMGSGVAVGDYDNDGDDDIYFVNARPDYQTPDPRFQNALFQNNGDGTFTDVTTKAGVGDTGYGMCALWGDIDNDGNLDLFVGNYGPNVLYKNNGDGTFTDSTEQAGVGHDGYVAAGIFGDVDRDGDLDLYVGNYIQFDPATDGKQRDMYHGMAVFSGPLNFQNQKDLLYLNDGQGRFTDVAEKAGVNVSKGRAMGGVFFDIDLDNDLDLYVTNDGTYNHVLQNRGDGTFEDISFLSGGAFNESGVEGASMGVSQGDFNNDGTIDLFITAYEQQPDVLYMNDGQDMFVDVSGPMGLQGETRMSITWGSGFADFDADGWLDIYTANGHIYPQVREMSVERAYEQGVSFYRNMGEKFFDVSDASLGKEFRPKNGRGSALLDFDNDGDLDIVINCIDSSPQLLENRTPQGHWLKVKLAGTSAHTLGVRVVAKNGGRTWTRVVDGGSSYLSQNSQTLHFGFGDIDSIDALTVYWMHREPETIASPKLDLVLTIDADP